MRDITFHPVAFKELGELSNSDKELYKKVFKIIENIQKELFTGISKPEPLKHNYQGYWSRRIDLNHRLIYKITETSVVIISCKSHYKDSNSK